MADLPEQRIDRAALERIMQRAAELQAGEADVGEGLTPAEVTALGREVGIPARYLQQAMLEHATDVVAPAERGLVGRLAGPAEVTAQRVILGEPEEAAAALAEWLERNELLVVQRQQPGRMTLEPLRGMQAALRRGSAAFGAARPTYMLARASLVSATFTRLESGYCHVSLTASLGETRGAHVGGALALGSVGVAGALVVSVLSPFWALLLPPLAVGAGLGWYALRSYRPVAARAALGLERALDFLERGGVKPSHMIPPRGGLLDTIAGEIRRAIAASSERQRPR
jgi:hypothetical protein